MKKIALFIVLLSLSALILACTNLQSSSEEEARFVVSSLSDCDRIIQYLNIRSGRAIDTPNDPFIGGSNPMITEESSVIVHEIIYKKKGEEKYALVLLDDDRPPKIVKNIDIGGETQKK
ncbi:MAG: hypothetical protein HY764_03300 [Candidatus Portnoybacteria bacterium]|nr:hypothetical protein [Candidatus Portnoybacteria bacterium]